MIDQETVQRVARLARLDLTEEEAAQLVTELGRILDHVDRLSELDVSQVPPLLHAASDSDVYREDEPGDTLPTGEALNNAPARDGDLFEVPKVIGDA